MWQSLHSKLVIMITVYQCLQVMDVDSDDVEVFDANSNNSTTATTSHFDHTLPITTTSATRTGSSSSSRKSSYDDMHQERSREVLLHPSPLFQALPGSSSKPRNGSPVSSIARPTVVEWRPEENQSDENSLPSTPQDGEDRNLGEAGGGASKEEEGEEMVRAEEVTSPKEEEEYMNGMYSSTVTVTIDPPRDGDQGDEDDPVTRYLGGGTVPRMNRSDVGGGECEGGGEGGSGAGVGCDGGGVWKLFGGDEEGEQEDEDSDLYECLNDFDMAEGEDCDTPPPVRICLLSRYSDTTL